MDWVTKEVKNINFGDKRLNKRFGNLLEKLGAKPTCSIPAACNGWHETKAAYRFFDNPNVTAEIILKGHKTSSIERIKQEKTVLLIQDSSEIDYTGHNTKSGLGLLNRSSRKGFLMHPLLAVTPEKLCLGVVDCQEVIRKELKGRNTTEYMRKPIEEKESYRWIKGYQVANEIAKQATDTLIVNVCDREGDIYELFVEASKKEVGNKAEWIIRAAQNRNLLTKDGKKLDKKLFDFAKDSPSIGNISFELPGNKNRTKRKVTQQIRGMEIFIQPPRSKGRNLKKLKMGVVYCCEINCPKGEEPIEWLLLTSLPTNKSEFILNVIHWYLCRWQIEIYFRVLKSGCKIEELQLEKAERLLPCLALYMIIAWRVMYVTMLGRSCSEMSCDVVFEDKEWKSVYMVINKKPPPQKPPTLDNMVKLIAGLGGFLNRRQDGYPGPQTIWIGLQRTRDFAIAWDAFNSALKAETYG